MPKRSSPSRSGASLVVLAVLLLLGSPGGSFGQAAGGEEGKPETPQQAPIRFGDSGTGDTIRVESAGPSVYHRLWIEATGEKPVEQVEMSITPLRTTDHKQGAAGDEVLVDLRVDGEEWTTPRTVTRGEPVLAELRAELPLQKTYRGFVTLSWEGGRLVRTLELVRSSATPSVEARGLATADGAPSLWLALRETGSGEVTVGLPSVLELERVLGENRKVQGRFDRLRVEVEPSRPTGEEKETTLSSSAAAPASTDLTIPRGESRRLRLQFQGLSEPGRYEGKLLVPVRGADPLEAPFSLSIRRSGWLAALLILVGVFASAVLEYVTKRSRPRLRRLRRVALLRRDLDRVTEPLTLDAQEAAVLQDLRQELDDVAEQVEMNVLSEVEEALKVPDARLSLFDAWLKVRRFVADLEPELSGAFAGELADAETVLGSRGATVEELDGAETALGGVEQKVRSARKRALLDRIEATDGEAKAVESRAKASPPDQLLLDRLRAEVTGPLAEAKGRLAADAPTKADLEKARELWSGAQGDLARIFASLLRRDLPAKAPDEFAAYGGQAEEQFRRLRADVEERIDRALASRTADEAMSAYSSAFCTYYAGLVVASRAWVEAARRDVEQAGGTEKKARLGRLEQADDGLDRVVSACAKKELAPVPTRYEAAVGEIAGVWEDLAGRPKAPVTSTRSGGSLSHFSLSGRAAPGAAEARGPELAGLLSGLGTLSGFRSRRSDLGPEALTARMRRLNWFVILLSIIAAVVLGLKILWADDPTWGTVDDILVAVLWGLGFHQVGSTAAGYAAVSEKLQPDD